jgi:hypothetical protein
MTDHTNASAHIDDLPCAWDFMHQRLGAHIAPNAPSHRALGQMADKRAQWSNKDQRFNLRNFSLTGGTVLVDSGSMSAILGNFEPTSVGPVQFMCTRAGFMEQDLTPLAHIIKWVQEGRVQFPFILIQLESKGEIQPHHVTWSYSPKRITVCHVKETRQFTRDIVNKAYGLIADTQIDGKSLVKALYVVERFYFPAGSVVDIARTEKDLAAIQKQHPSLTQDRLLRLYHLIKPGSMNCRALCTLLSA